MDWRFLTGFRQWLLRKQVHHEKLRSVLWPLYCGVKKRKGSIFTRLMTKVEQRLIQTHNFETSNKKHFLRACFAGISYPIPDEKTDEKNNKLMSVSKVTVSLIMTRNFNCELDYE